MKTQTEIEQALAHLAEGISVAAGNGDNLGLKLLLTSKDVLNWVLGDDSTKSAFANLMRNLHTAMKGRNS